jgi:cytochrome c-type biogenesis protein CcmH/NrfG
LVSFLFFAEILNAKSEISLSDKKLAEIITTQERFFSQSKSGNKPSLKEMTRQAQEIVTAYESYLSHNPEDTSAIILFGKFLRQVGQEEYAVEFFLRADQVNPKLAVVKQQLANYLVEKG